MNVWWCFVSSGARCQHLQGRDGHDKCGLRRLVPVDALVLVRDADGNRPIPADTPKHYWHRDVVNDVLDALEAAKENSNDG